MTDARPILVLGAYGLAGRAIVRGLLEATPHAIVAGGRNPARLAALARELPRDRLATRILDVADEPALREACRVAALVINAVGPYAERGADTARIVIESARPYIDCANEQIHYRRLQTLDALARTRDVLLVTAAGAVPGCSSLLAAHLLERFPEATRVDCYWAQFRHAYEDAGHASVMGGILETGHRPVALRDGRHVPVAVGRSVETVVLPAPFGTRRMLEVPTIDALTVPAHFPLRDLRTWFSMGDLPTWVLSVVRLLRPDRRRWAYRLVDGIVRRLGARDTARAIAAGLGPEALLVVTARAEREARTRHLLFRDGAVATAVLPVRIARDCLAGRWSRRGLVTPLDLLEPDEVLQGLGDAVLRIGST